MEIKCPNCDSGNVHESPEEIKRGSDLGFGVTFTIDVHSHFCDDCGFEGSFDGEMDRKYTEAYGVAHGRLIQIVSDRLRSIGSDVEIERALHLFPRTLRKWREAKEFSYTATALFKLLAKYPHILDAELRERRKRTAKAASSID